MMLLVVPGKECACPSSRIRLAAKAARIIGTILQGLELSFRVGIIVGHMWARMGFRHTQIGQEKRHGFRSHGTASVRMDGELVGLNPLARTSFCNQFFR